MIARPTQELMTNVLHAPFVLGSEWKVIYQKLDRTLIFRAYYGSIAIDDVDDEVVRIVPLFRKVTTAKRIVKRTKIHEKKVLSLIYFLLKKGILGGATTPPILRKTKQKRAIKMMRGMSIFGSSAVIGIIGTSDVSMELVSHLSSEVRQPATIYIYTLGGNKASEVAQKKFSTSPSGAIIKYITLGLSESVNHMISHKALLLGQSSNQRHNTLINTAVLQNKLTWIPFFVDMAEEKGYIGPLTKEQSHACYRCFWSRYTEGKMYHREDILVHRRAPLQPSFKKKFTNEFVEHIAQAMQDAERLLTDHAYVVDLAINNKKRHYLLKKYSCKHDIGEMMPTSSLQLRSRIAKSNENGLRTRTADEVFKKGKNLLGELGIVTSLKKIEKKSRELEITTFRSISANPLDKKNEEYARVHFGKGVSDKQNRNSALLEGIERYTSKLITYKDCLYASYSEVSDRAVNPKDFTIPTNIGYSNTKKIHWVWGYSLTTKKRTLIPLMLVTIPNSIATTSGIASGNTLEEAILHGIFEVIERDAVYIVELNTLSMPDVRVENVNNSSITTQLAILKKHNIDYFIKYITNTIEVPVFQVYLKGELNGKAAYGYGVGAHLTKDIALTRAITEALQSYPTLADADWIQTRPLNHYTDSGNKVLEYKDIPNYMSNDILEHIKKCTLHLQKNNMEVYIVNLVKEQIDFSVVRVMITGVQPAMTSKYPRISKRVALVPKMLNLKERKTLKMGYFPGFIYYPAAEQKL